ncbi:ABC transporter permease subunit [Litorimonas haliclonae]|uniref:ABC transporter permease subunit n=1 Tax=Litorimonas haliclonae TaxID=2081977 RepID=UPI0039EEB5DD
MLSAKFIARKDRTEIVRDKRLVVAIVLVGLLSLAAIMTSYARVDANARDRAAATAQERKSWLAQGERNPHSAAHFAQWTFRPLDAPTLLDPAATDYAGSAIWLEAHARNSAAFRPIETRAATLDLGRLSAGWVLQTFGPLLAFLLGAGLVARERERGTLRLMLASGAAPRQLLYAKTSGLLVTIGLVSIPILLAAGATVIMAPGAVTADIIIRTMLWSVFHIAWLVLAVLFAISISTLIKKTARVLLILVGLWVLAVPVMPRAVSGLAEVIHPTPSAAQFWADARSEISNGFDERGDRATRDKALEAGLLAEYGVKTTDDLPISYRGARLDASERFGNEVYARRYALLEEVYADQRETMRLGAILSPFIAMQNISAALAGTDNRHLRHFEMQAEAERQTVVNALNRDLMINAVGVEDYTADEELWSSFEVFEPTPLPISDAVKSIVLDILILLAWLIGAFWLLSRATRALRQEMLG